MSAYLLFVDDDHANLQVLEALCERHFSVLTAPNADAALLLMRRHDVGVIVADQRMPGMTGVELLEKVCEEFPDTIRMIVTAYMDLPAAIDAINRGRVRRYIRKPFMPDDLLAHVRDAMDLYTTNRKVRWLQTRLTETERVYAVGAVTAGVATELRAPLTELFRQLDMIQSSLAEVGSSNHGRPPTCPCHAGPIRAMNDAIDGASQGARRIEEVLEGLELTARPPPPSGRPVDLGDALRTTLRLVRRQLREHASLELDVSGVPQVLASTAQISQVALNLIVFSLQHVRNRPRRDNVVTMRVRRQSGWAILEVCDNCVGVEPQQLSHLFDPFHVDPDIPASGLSLAISKRIVEDLGGQIEVDVPEEGGTLLRVKVPAV